MNQRIECTSANDAKGRIGTDIKEALEYGNRVLDHLQGRWPAQVAVRYPRPLTIVYASYPYWFVEAFPGLVEHDVRRLAVALRVVADSVCVTDTVCDLDAPERLVTDVLTIQSIQFEAYQLLYRMFPPHAPFWSRFQEDMKEWMTAIALEAETAQALRNADGPERSVLDRIARGKAAMARTVIAGLVELSGDATLLDILTSSVDHCHFGVQLLDDLTDWRADLKRGAPSEVVTTLLSARPDLAEMERTEDVLDTFARELYYGDLARDTIQRAIEELDAAMSLTQDLPTRRWHARISRCRDRCNRLAYDLSRIGQASLADYATPPFAIRRGANSDVEDAMVRGLMFLAREQASGFGEARHYLAYPWEFDPLGEMEPQGCDVYQRALVLQGLAEIRTIAPDIVDEMIETEIGYLLHSRCPKTGAWSYFPTVNEIVVSADVVAQVVIALRSASSSADVVRATGMAIQSALLQCGRDDGSFLNWSMSDEWPRSDHIVDALTLDCEWLNAADVEVAASMATAMSLEDPEVLRCRIGETVRWVGTQQYADGRWGSRGQYGHVAYSTFVCVRAVGRIAGHCKILARTRSDLMRELSLHGDSGHRRSAFGVALTLLTLSELARSETPNADMASAPRVAEYTREACRYLVSKQRRDGAWPSTSFLRIGRMGFAQPTFEYGSRTVTTVFVLRALQRHRPLAVNGNDT